VRVNDGLDKAPTKQLLSRFDAAHIQRFRVPAYILGGKHAKMLANIWKLYGTERTLALMDLFFDGNSFADDCGYSVEVFASQVPRLLMRLAATEIQRDRVDWEVECKEQHGGMCATAFAHDARRHIRRTAS
jgi:hypothetical protein